MDLLSDFRALPPPQRAGAASFSVVPVPGFPHTRIGKGVDGEPALLVTTDALGWSASLPPIRLTHLSVQHGLRCRIEAGRRTTEATFAVVRLVASDRTLADYFLEVLPPVIRRIGELPTSESLHVALTGLVELFRSLGDPPRKSIQGVWAELFVLARAANPAVLAAAWHRMPEERFDFAEGDQRVEVKSAAGRRRCHHFSLEQARPPTGATVLIASVLLERSTGGTSLGDLLARIRSHLGGAPGLAASTEGVVAASLGSALPEALGAAFDEELALSSLRFYWGQSIPCVETPLPSRVSDVHFTADLSDVPEVDSTQFGERHSLFSACREKRPTDLEGRR